MRYLFYIVIALFICRQNVSAAVTPSYHMVERVQPSAVDTSVKKADSFSIRDRSYLFLKYLGFAGTFKIVRGRFSIAPLSITFNILYPHAIIKEDTAMLNVTSKFFAGLIAGSVLADSATAFESVNICYYDLAKKRCKYYQEYSTRKLLSKEWNSSEGKAVIFADAILDAAQSPRVDTLKNEFTYIIPTDYTGPNIEEHFESRSSDLGRLFYVYVLLQDRRFKGVSFTFHNKDKAGKEFKKTYHYSRNHPIFKGIRKTLAMAKYPASL